jgi:membrane protease YdiL (CAAX protease family)
VAANRRAGRLRAALATVGVLVVVAVCGQFGPQHTMLVVGPLGAALLLLLGRRAGLSADDVGLGRGSWGRGAAYAVVCIAAVAAVYTVAVLVPVTRSAFHDERYRIDVGAAVLTAFVVIPLSTVLFEEVAFRGVLWGLLCSTHGPVQATLVSSALFGVWHVLPSLRLNQVNPAVADLVGPGWAGQAKAVAGTVMFTALAGALLCELRRRSGSLLAPAGLHWAANGLGVLISAGMPR